MGAIKNVITSPLFVCGTAMAIGLALIIESHPLYAGMAFGYGVGKFIEAFKTIE